MGRIFIYWIAGFVFLYVQVFFVHWIDIMGIIPNVLVGFVIFAGHRLSRNQVGILAFVIGLAHDLTTVTTLGLGTLSLLIIAWLVGTFHENLNKEKALNIALAVALLVFVHCLIHALYWGLGEAVPGGFFLYLWLSFIYSGIVNIAVVYMLAFLESLKISATEE